MELGEGRYLDFEAWILSGKSILGRTMKQFKMPMSRDRTMKVDGRRQGREPGIPSSGYYDIDARYGE
jgi:hypothetical protein